ncbi:MAG: hypothetical protein P8Y45_02955 [Exilibacterium sp.]
MIWKLENLLLKVILKVILKTSDMDELRAVNKFDVPYIISPFAYSETDGLLSMNQRATEFNASILIEGYSLEWWSEQLAEISV